MSGQEVPADALARREMNFRHPFPGHAAPLPYLIRVGKEEFLNKMKGVYEQATREEMADALYHQKGEWPLLDGLQKLGYPLLEELLEHQPKVVEGLIQEWLDQETLDRLVPGSKKNLPRFLINSIDRVIVNDCEVSIEGIAYSHPMGKDHPQPSPVDVNQLKELER